MTVAELPAFAREADRILGERSHQQLIDFLGLNPAVGVIVPDTGGVRKVRWAVPGRRKRSGARVIYYFHNENLPLLALDIYAKNRRENLTATQKTHLREIVERFVKSHIGGK
jgi:hypothetical protein